MHPRIVAISGPQRGSVFMLPAETVTLGREEANWLCVDEPSASRKHCRITPAPEGFEIADLESKNGTFVNGIPIRRISLKHGDRIELGSSVYLFLVDDEERPAPVQPGKGILARPTVRLRLEDALYLEPEKLLTSTPLTLRIAQGLDAVLKLSRSIHQARSFLALEQGLVECAQRFIPAQRGRIVPAESAGDAALPGDVIRQVLRERITILSNEIVSEADGGPKVSALIAAPMILQDRLLGVFYVETADPSVRFDEDHLQFASAIAAIGALAMNNLQQVEVLQRDHHQLVEDIRAQHTLVGETEAMKQVYGTIAKVSPTDSTVLITGETGTGKELVARSIHLNSPRANKAFVAVNCATLSESLLESELFGHEKGAFTGAIAQKKGKLEVADGGTLFLDEVGDLTPAVQAKILRVLQEREFERVGGIRTIKVDVRLITATNKNLADEVQAGRFRQDLLYRIQVLQISMPSLRERREDIPLLVHYFLSKFSAKMNRRLSGVSEEAMRCLIHNDWPGNVRELENAMERAVVLSVEEVIRPEDLPETVLEGSEPAGGGATRYYELLQEAKKKLVRDAFQQSHGNHAEAARILGVQPNNLYRLMKSLKLK